MKVLIVAALAKQVAGMTAADENTVLDLPLGFIVGMGHPAFQVFAVEQLDPILVIVLLVIRRNDRRGRQCQAADQYPQSYQ